MRFDVKIFSIIILLTVIVVVSGCIGQQQSVTGQATGGQYVNDRNENIAGDYVVTITAQGFNPQEIRVPQYTTIVWSNEDTKGQTVYFPDLAKASPSINPGRSWSITLNETGEYPYYSQFYVSLKGTITVY